MKNTISEMLQHPLATILIIGSIGTAVARIVSASKSVSIKPFVDITLRMKPSPNSLSSICPNSFYCYVTENKPYFERKEEQK